jgi:coproporphyrinogen III oxidase-like Fe-S oxidoreductase
METMESDQGAGELKVLDEGDRVFEFMLNALRLTETFDEAQFASRTGLQATALRARLEELRDKRLLDELGNGVWRVSPLGQRFVNDLQAAFLP